MICVETYINTSNGSSKFWEVIIEKIGTSNRYHLTTRWGSLDLGGSSKPRQKTLLSDVTEWVVIQNAHKKIKEKLNKNYVFSKSYPAQKLKIADAFRMKDLKFDKEIKIQQMKIQDQTPNLGFDLF